MTITEDDEYVVWTVTSADTANVGNGKCELQYLEDDVVVKSRTWTTRTFPALEEAGEAPDPESGWVAQMMADIDEKLAAQGVDSEEVNNLIAAYLEANPVTQEIPVYDLAEMGMETLMLGSGQYVTLMVTNADLANDIENLKTIIFKFNLTDGSETMPCEMPVQLNRLYYSMYEMFIYFAAYNILNSNNLTIIAAVSNEQVLLIIELYS